MNIGMACIHCHSSCLPIPSPLRHRHSKTTRLLWLPIKEPTELLRRQNAPSILLPPRTQALTTSSIFLGLSSSPSAPSVNTSVFIATSAVFFFLYWITNFVVPDIISKYLQSKDPSEEHGAKDKNPLEGEKSAKKRGFGQGSKL